MDDIFNGLIEVGMSIQQVEDLSRGALLEPRATPGSWTHERDYVGVEFVVVARRAER